MDTLWLVHVEVPELINLSLAVLDLVLSSRKTYHSPIGTISGRVPLVTPVQGWKANRVANKEDRLSRIKI